MVYGWFNFTLIYIFVLILFTYMFVDYDLHIWKNICRCIHLTLIVILLLYNAVKTTCKSAKMRRRIEIYCIKQNKKIERIYDIQMQSYGHLTQLAELIYIHFVYVNIYCGNNKNDIRNRDKMLIHQKLNTTIKVLLHIFNGTYSIGEDVRNRQ